MGVLIALAIVALVAIIPLGFRASYDSGGALVYLLVGPIRIPLYPIRKKTKKSVQKGTKQKSKKSKADKKKKGGSLSDFLPLLDAVIDFLDDFVCRKLRMKQLQLKVVLAGEDPCDLAVNYGRAWAVVGNLIPVLERFFVIKKRDLQVDCDFDGEKTLIDAHLALSITVGRLIGLGFSHGIRVLREYLRIMKLRKGGAV